MTTDDISGKIQAGEAFDTGALALPTTLGTLKSWIDDFAAGLALPDLFQQITGQTGIALPGVAVTIQDVSLITAMRTTLNITLQIAFVDAFYEGLPIAPELKAWFSAKGMDFCLTYTKPTEAG